jgi:hypothetical protein
MKSILRNCFFLSAIITLYSSSVISQVKIHERVTIQTNKLDVDSTGKYMPGQKVISPPINKSMQITGAMITVPESSYVTVTVLSADAASIIDLILRSPFNQTIIPNASWNVGAKWGSPFFSTETVLDVGIFWMWRNLSGYEYGVEMSQVAENEYILYFEDLGDLYGPYIDYDDLVVDVRIHGKPDHLNVTVDPDSIFYGEYTNITAVAIDNEGNEMLLGDDAIMTLSAEPSSIGSFYPSNEVLFSDFRNGYVGYSADQEEPTSIQDIVVTVSGEGVSGTAKVVVKRNPCIVMSISSDRIHPGESVDITMQQLDCFGNLIPYPPDQYFYIWMKSDSKYGKLRDQSGNEDSYVEGVQPFKFIAADSIDVDTTVVEIEAWTWSGGGASRIAGVGVKDTLGNPPIAKILPKPGEILAMRNEAMIKCIELAIDRLHKSINDLSSEEKKLKVKGEYSKGFLTDTPSKKSNNATLMKLAKLEEKLKKRLAEVKAAAPVPPGPVPSGVKYTTAQANTKDKLMIASDGAIDCRSVVYVTITKEEPELVVIYPTDNLLDRKDIDRTPEMPDIGPRAYLKNYSGGEVKFQWNLRVQWEGPDGRKFDDSFPGETNAQNSDVSTWWVNWKEIIRGGDEITLDVTATTGKDVYNKTVNPGFKITGLNPSPSDIRSGLGIEEQVIVYKESLPKWHHFINDGDFPIFGGPHGYGLMQLDKPRATPEQVWNWKANRDEGQRRYNEKKNLAQSYSTRINDGRTWYWKDEKNNIREYNDPIKPHWDWYPHAYSNATTLIDGEELLKEAFQRYNGGVYWRWVPEVVWDKNSRGKWEKVTTGTYGDEAWNIYDGIVNHNTFPDGWN